MGITHGIFSGESINTLEKICRPERVRAIKLAESLSVFEEYESQKKTRAVEPPIVT
jgi:hypothetical protein